MGTVGLCDISVTPLRRISAPAGDVLHAMKASDGGYDGFGEAYFSWVIGGAVKAWKRHLSMTMNLIVPIGHIRFVFRQAKLNGIDEFRIEEIGDKCYSRITVPPGIWFGFQGRAMTASLLLNIASISHDPDEVERLSITDINYTW